MSRKVFNSNSHIYDRQLILADKISKSFFEINHLTLPSWVNKIQNANKTFDVNKIRAFDLLSANTLLRITNELKNKNEEPHEKTINIVNDLIYENEALRQELESLYHAFSNRIVNKVKKERKRITNYDLKDPLRLLTEIIHRHFLGKTGITPQVTYTFLTIINFVLSSILLNITLEAKGKDLFDTIFGESEKQMPQIIVNNYSAVNNYYYIYQDTVIQDANVYLRNSLKTSSLGHIKKGTVVIILQQKPKWCYIETIVKSQNKKTKKVEEQLVKGWVLKKHLSYFQ